MYYLPTVECSEDAKIKIFHSIDFLKKWDKKKNIWAHNTLEVKQISKKISETLYNSLLYLWFYL
jgi:hypothetical protein